MHAHTAEMLEIGGSPCQGPSPAAADEILSGPADLCGTAESLTEVVVERDEETMRFLDEIYWCTHTHMHRAHDHPPVYWPVQTLTFSLHYAALDLKAGVFFGGGFRICFRTS